MPAQMKTVADRLLPLTLPFIGKPGPADGEAFVRLRYEEELKKKKIAVLPVENLSMMREINLAYMDDFTQVDMLHGIITAYNETLRSYK